MRGVRLSPRAMRGGFTSALEDEPRSRNVTWSWCDHRHSHALARLAEGGLSARVVQCAMPDTRKLREACRFPWEFPYCGGAISVRKIDRPKISKE
jgi:hypothetical protein